MKKTIFKYKLEITDKQIIEMPINSKILTVQTQNEVPRMWVLANPLEAKEKRCIEIFGTGHNVNSDMDISRNYLGTFQIRSGALVFHVFEYTEI